MDDVCFSCKLIFQLRSLKTSRSRFKIMGITPPEGMGLTDRICNKCLHKMYDEQIKQNNVKLLKKNIALDLLGEKKRKLPPLPKKIEVEKKKKILS